MGERGHEAAKRQRARDRRAPLYWWAVLLLAVGLHGYGGFVGLAWWLQANAHEFGGRAMKKFPGDEVDALIAFAQSDKYSVAERNRAVNALGQIGAERALPMLEKFYTGRECEHAKFLCQKELRKAIDRCSGKNWAPRWLPFFPRAPVSA